MGMNFDASVEHPIQEIVDYFRLPVSIRKAEWGSNDYFTIEKIDGNIVRGKFYKSGQIKKKLFGSYHYRLSDNAYIIGDARDKDGYDLDGYDSYGYDRKGYDKAGFNCDGYDQNGYNRSGYNCSGYDSNGFDRDGFDAADWDKNGYDRDGFNSVGLDSEGYNRQGFDTDGYNRNGCNAIGYNREGYDAAGFDKYGFDAELRNEAGKQISLYWLEEIDCCPFCRTEIIGEKLNRNLSVGNEKRKLTVYLCSHCKKGFLKYIDEVSTRGLHSLVSGNTLTTRKEKYNQFKLNEKFARMEEEERTKREKIDELNRKIAEEKKRKYAEEKAKEAAELKNNAEQFSYCYSHYKLSKETMSALMHISWETREYLRKNYTAGSLLENQMGYDPAIPEPLRTEYRAYFDKKYREQILDDCPLSLISSMRIWNLEQIEGLYFMYYYFPKRKHNTVKEGLVYIAQLIWAYKDWDSDAIDFFTEHLSAAITFFSDYEELERFTSFALLSIPSSKTDKQTPIRESITRIVDESHKDSRRFNKQLIDAGASFVRIHDVPSSHMGERVDYDTHKSSIRFNGPLYDPNTTLYIIMDDILTTGTQFYVCRDMLISNGVPSKSIIVLTIGRTVS